MWGKNVIQKRAMPSFLTKIYGAKLMVDCEVHAGQVISWKQMAKPKSILNRETIIEKPISNLMWQ